MELSSVINMQLKLAQLGQAGQSSSANAVSQLLGQAGQVSSSTSAANTVSQLLAPANQRVSQQLQSTNVQLSAYGQIKSAFGSAQTAAGSVVAAATSKTASNSDVEKAAQAFVDAYNQASQAVGTAVNGTGKQAGALATDFRAKVAGSDLAQALTGGTGLADLKQAGITQNKNGTLTLDTKVLDQALQSNSTQTKGALARLGQQVGTSAGRELASGGNVGASVGSLTSRSQSLTAQQTALQQQAAVLQNTLEKQSAVLNYATAGGLAAYKSLLG
jgi:flagellar capping protein FliD